MKDVLLHPNMLPFLGLVVAFATVILSVATIRQTSRRDMLNELQRRLDEAVRDLREMRERNERLEEERLRLYQHLALSPERRPNHEC